MIFAISLKFHKSLKSRPAKLHIIPNETTNKHAILIVKMNVLDMLMEKDLPPELFDAAFTINWRAKHNKFSISFDPINFGWDGKNLYYLAQIVRKYSEKWNLEGESIYLWYYTKEFVDYLINKGLDIDRNRANVNQGYLRKQIALDVISHYK